jgi:hypothetical protein
VKKLQIAVLMMLTPALNAQAPLTALQLDNLAPGVTQQVIAVTYTWCGPPTPAVAFGPCTSTGSDLAITTGHAYGQNSFDEKGNVFALVRHPLASVVPLAMVNADSSSSVRLADFTLSPNGTLPCVQLGPGLWAQSVRGVGPLAYNLAPQVRALFINTVNTQYLYRDAQCGIFNGMQYTTALIRVRR